MKKNKTVPNKRVERTRVRAAHPSVGRMKNMKYKIIIILFLCLHASFPEESKYQNITNNTTIIHIGIWSGGLISGGLCGLLYYSLSNPNTYPGSLLASSVSLGFITYYFTTACTVLAFKLFDETFHSSGGTIILKAIVPIIPMGYLYYTVYNNNFDIVSVLILLGYTILETGSLILLDNMIYESKKMKNSSAIIQFDNNLVINIPKINVKIRNNEIIYMADMIEYKY